MSEAYEHFERSRRDRVWSARKFALCLEGKGYGCYESRVQIVSGERPFDLLVGIATVAPRAMRHLTQRSWRRVNRCTRQHEHVRY